MLKPGDTAPAFTLHADDGSTISLDGLKGKKVVLYFYPKDLTPGCTTEACEFRDNWGALKRYAVVLGVSPDSIESHRKFRDKHALNFPLLEDTNYQVSDAYGVWGEKSMYGRKYMGVLRTTFVIDEQGRIARIFEKVKPEGHAAQVLEAVQA
jgi:peroxiredoxin Q/BCP